MVALPQTDQPYVIEKLCLTKKKSNVVAHATVRFGAAWVRFRIVNTARGLFVFPPANPCPGPNGRTYYKRSAGVDDPQLRDQLSEDILKALEVTLEEQHRNPPKPLPKPEKRPNRVTALLEAIADDGDVDVAEQGRYLFDRLTDLLDDPEVTSRETVSAAKILTKLVELQTDRFVAKVKSGAFAA